MSEYTSTTTTTTTPPSSSPSPSSSSSSPGADQQRWFDRLSLNNIRFSKNARRLRTPPRYSEYSSKSRQVLLSDNDINPSLALFQNKPVMATAYTNAFLNHRVEFSPAAPEPAYQVHGELQSQGFGTGFQWIPQQGVMYIHGNSAMDIPGVDAAQEGEEGKRKKKSKKHERKLLINGHYQSAPKTHVETTLQYKSTDHNTTLNVDNQGQFEVTLSQALTKNLSLGIMGMHSISQRLTNMALAAQWARGDSTWSAEYRLGDRLADNVQDSDKRLRLNYVSKVSPVFSYAAELLWNVKEYKTSYRLGLARTLVTDGNTRVRVSVDDTHAIYTAVELSMADFAPAPFQIGFNAKADIPNKQFVYGLMCGYAA